MSNATSMTPSSRWEATSYPAAANTASILRLLGRVEAAKRRSPRSRPAAARNSSMTVASPRPLWSSSMKNATSAVSVPVYRS